MASFWSELRKRRVVHVAGVYAVVAWLVVEVATTTFPLLGLPAWAPTLVLALALLGFPIALVLAWALELTPEGVRRTPPRDGARERRSPRVFLAYVGTLAVVALLAIAGHARYRRPASVPIPGDVRIGSIAVLPFLDLSAEGNQEHFGMGMAEQLLDVLAKVPGLQVTARTSSFQFQGRGVDVREVGRKLNVEAVIEGSVRKDRDRLRITAQLVKTSDGYHLWSETYDRQLSDVFAVQDEISRAILRSVRPRLVGDSLSGPTRAPTQNLAAYELFLRANHALASALSAADLQAAVDGFERAVALDPDFALAYAALSEAYQWLGMVTPPTEPLARAERASLRSLELDAELAEGYASLANLRHTQWRWAEATELYRKSIALNPTLAAACHCYGFHLLVLQQRGAAIQELERARALDPVSPYSYMFLAQAYYLAGQMDTARAQVAQGLALSPDDEFLRIVAAWLARREGDLEAALDQLTRGVAVGEIDIGTRHPYTIAEIGFTLGRAGRRREAAELLRRMDAYAERSYISPVWFAAVHAGMGDEVAALAWLERAYREQSPDITMFVTGAVSEPLQGVPGYRDFLRRIGLPADAHGVS